MKEYCGVRSPLGPSDRVIFFSLIALGLGAPATSPAQDISGPVMLLLPAVLLAPVLAAGIKSLVLTRIGQSSLRPRKRDLALAGGLEVLLWLILYPAGALLDVRVVSWWTRESYLLVAALISLVLAAAVNRRFLGNYLSANLAADSPYRSWLILGGFALLTPVLVIALALASYGLLGFFS